MTNHIPPEFLTAVAKERGVSDTELETVIMALDGNSTAEIATILGISNIAVRKRLVEVYRKFSLYGRGPGKLAELRHQLFSQYQAQETEPPAPLNPTDAKTEGIGELLSREDIKRRYPQEWVLIAYKELNPDQSVKTGELLAHSPDCDEIENRLLEFRGKPLAIEYTGPFVPDHAGVLM